MLYGRKMNHEPRIFCSLWKESASGSKIYTSVRTSIISLRTLATLAKGQLALVTGTIRIMYPVESTQALVFRSQLPAGDV